MVLACEIFNKDVFQTIQFSALVSNSELHNVYRYLLELASC